MICMIARSFGCEDRGIDVHSAHMKVLRYPGRRVRKTSVHGSPTTQQPPIGFALGTNPLLRERIEPRCAAPSILSHDDIVAYGQAIFGRLEAVTVPWDRGWPAGPVALFKHWLAQGGSE